jgi:hypothetical protein
MSTELARALDEELAAHGVNPTDLGGPEIAYALLLFQELAASIKERDPEGPPGLKALRSRPDLERLDVRSLHGAAYRELRNRLAHDGPRGLDVELLRTLVDRLPGSAAPRVDPHVELDDEDYAALSEVLASRLARRQARRDWEAHVGPLLTHQQALELTGWSKQALSQAAQEHRILRLKAAQGGNLYPQASFDDASPARSLPGAKRVFSIWAPADPKSWATAAWLVSEQVELDGRTPREVMLGPEEDVAVVADLARQAVQRLAA